MIKRLLISLSLIVGVASSFAYASPAFAVDPLDNACKGTANESSVCEDNKQETVSGANGVLYTITRIISAVAGVAAVIVMIVGGLMYITSDGDPSKASTAKNTIIYALVGLLVIALSNFIIGLVLNMIDN